MQSETKFKQKFLLRLKTLPSCWVEKIQQVGIRGTPDLLLCVAGVFVGIELKRHAKARLAPLQDLKLKEISRAGGLAFVCYPENANDILRTLSLLEGDPRRGSDLPKYPEPSLYADGPAAQSA